MDKIMNEKESLELITRMIDNTRKGIEKNAAVPMIVFGYASVITSLAVWIALRITNNYMYNLLWMAIPVLGWTLYSLIGRNRTRSRGLSNSHMGLLIGRIWILISGVMLLCMAATFLLRGDFPVTFIMALLAAIGVCSSGLMVLYKPFIVCGILGILLSFVFLWVKGLDSVLLICATFAIIMVIPGHMLHYAANKKQNNNA